MSEYNEPKIRVNVRRSPEKDDVDLDVAPAQTIGATKAQLRELDPSFAVDQLKLNGADVDDNTTIAELCTQSNEPLVFSAKRRTLEVSVKPRKKRCSADNCTSAPLRGIGNCASCQGHFCSKHRLMERHHCVGLQGCKQQLHERNALRLQEQQTVGHKV